VKEKKCLICGNQSDKNFSIITTETREGLGLWEKCNNCGLSINRKGVEKDTAKDFYNESYQKKNSLESGKQQSANEHFLSRKSSAKKIAERLYPLLKPTMSVYELGAGTGELLFYLKDKVKSCEANEINKIYSDFIESELNIKSSHNDFLKEKFKNQFDMIISICTIDHIYEITEILDKVYKNLKKDGLFYLEIPNDSQVLNKYLKPVFSKFMYQKAHYYSFNIETIGKLLKKVGFKIKNIETRQEYTSKNFLNWYFTNKPQKSFNEATSENKMLDNFNDEFELSINKLFNNFDEGFKKIVLENKLGDTICVVAKK